MNVGCPLQVRGRVGLGTGEVRGSYLLAIPLPVAYSDEYVTFLWLSCEAAITLLKGRYGL